MGPHIGELHNYPARQWVSERGAKVRGAYSKRGFRFAAAAAATARTKGVKRPRTSEPRFWLRTRIQIHVRWNRRDTKDVEGGREKGSAVVMGTSGQQGTDRGFFHNILVGWEMDVATLG